MNFEKIWQEYKSALKSFLHSRVANEADVEDLLQEVLIKTYNNLAVVKKQESIKSWLFQVANNTLIDFYRKNGKSTNIQADELWHSQGSAEVNKALQHCISPLSMPCHMKMLSYLKPLI